MILSTQQLDRLTISFQIIEPNLDRFETILYAKLFEIDPSLESLFPKSMTSQMQQMGNAIKLLVKNIRDIDTMADMLRGMGAKHVCYGATARHYPAIVYTILFAMSEILGETWTLSLHNDWAEVLNVISGYMIEGANGVDKISAA